MRKAERDIYEEEGAWLQAHKCVLPLSCFPELNPQLLFNIGKQRVHDEMDHAIRLEIIEKQMWSILKLCI
jgi:hypothetical protein